MLPCKKDYLFIYLFLNKKNPVLTGKKITDTTQIKKMIFWLVSPMHCREKFKDRGAYCKL